MESLFHFSFLSTNSWDNVPVTYSKLMSHSVFTPMSFSSHGHQDSHFASFPLLEYTDHIQAQLDVEEHFSKQFSFTRRINKDGSANWVLPSANRMYTSPIWKVGEEKVRFSVLGGPLFMYFFCVCLLGLLFSFSWFFSEMHIVEILLFEGWSIFLFSFSLKVRINPSSSCRTHYQPIELTNFNTNALLLGWHPTSHEDVAESYQKAAKWQGHCSLA